MRMHIYQFQPDKWYLSITISFFKNIKYFQESTDVSMGLYSILIVLGGLPRIIFSNFFFLSHKPIAHHSVLSIIYSHLQFSIFANF